MTKEISCPNCNLKFSENIRFERHIKKAHPVKQGYEELNPHWHESVSY